MAVLVLCAAAVLTAVMLAAWAFQRARNNSGWTDVFWTFGVGTIAAAAALWPLQEREPTSRQWLAALGKSYTLILKLDNHGRKVDLCKATTVLLDKSSTAADYQQALGVDPVLVGLVLQDTSGTTVSKLDPKMRAFFASAGIPAKHAKTLTS